MPFLPVQIEKTNKIFEIFNRMPEISRRSDTSFCRALRSSFDGSTERANRMFEAEYSCAKYILSSSDTDERICSTVFSSSSGVPK